MSPIPDAAAPAERGWFSPRFPGPLWFALATAVVVVACVALRFGVPIYRQHQAIHEFARLRGTVALEPRGPEWLRRRVPGEWMKLYSEMVGVDCSGREVTDATLALFKGQADMQWLELDGTLVTDAGLAHLGELSGLHTLVLSDTQISDAGLVHLKGLMSLRTLEIGGTRVTDAGLAHLQGLTGLTRLMLSVSAVTDDGLGSLKGLTHLKVLGLHGTRVTEAGVAELQRALPGLTIYH